MKKTEKKQNQKTQKGSSHKRGLPESPDKTVAPILRRGLLEHQQVEDKPAVIPTALRGQAQPFQQALGQFLRL